VFWFGQHQIEQAVLVFAITEFGEKLLFGNV